MGDTHLGDAQSAHGVSEWELGRTWDPALAGRSKSRRHTWMGSNDVINAHKSSCVHRWAAQETEPQSLCARGQRRSPESADTGNSERMGRVEDMRKCVCKGQEL